MRRRLPLLRQVVLLTAALLVTALVILLFVRVPRVVTAPGALAGGSVAVRAPWAGRVAEVLVAAGQAVHAGDALVRLEAGPLAADLEQARVRAADLEEQSAALTRERERLRVEAHPREHEQAELAREKAQLELEQARHRSAISAAAYDKGVASREQLFEAQAAEQLAEVTLRDAKAAVPGVASRQRGDLETLDARIGAMNAEAAMERSRLAELEREHAEATLRADSDGAVAEAGFADLTGRAVESGEELMRIAVGPPTRFDGMLGDSGRASVRAGQKVKIRLDAYPWLLHGTLAGRVATVAEHASGGTGYAVSIACEPGKTPGPLHDGLRGTARIVVDENVTLVKLLVERMVGAPKR